MLLLQDGSPNAIIEWFIPENNRGIAGAEDTAMSWIIAGIVIAVLTTCSMIFLKWFLKERAPLPKKHWAMSKVLLYILFGLLPVFFVLWVVYYFNNDFTMIVEIGGFFKGVLITWLLYILLMIGIDLLTPWARPDWLMKRRA